MQNKKLQDFEGELKTLAEKTYEHRLHNNSLVPLNLFPYCLAIGGISSVVEILLECFDGEKLKGYVLKKRGEDESGWQEQYHIPGTIIRLNDDTNKIFNRINKEIWGENKPIYKKDPKYFGTEIHDETQRKVIRTNRLYIAEIDVKNIEKLNGNWQIFKGDEKKIVEHHKEIIKWKKGVYQGEFIHLPPSN